MKLMMILYYFKILLIHFKYNFNIKLKVLKKDGEKTEDESMF